jgi:F5/8 type C domain
MTIILLLVSMSWLYHRIQSTQRVHHQHGHKTLITTTSPITLLTDTPSGIVITADVRGNLGPPESMLNNGTDWIKDRWQAASDMHGTAIKGVHWVHLDFQRLVTISTVILDWEAAYSDDYKIEGRLNDSEEYVNLFDSDNDVEQRKTSEAGQSPGVKTKTPLHIIHSIEIIKESKQIQQIKIWIRSSTMGWGVSLWEVKVWGRKY